MNNSLKKYFPVFLLPTLLAFVISFVIPFAVGIYLSFCEFKVITDTEFVGFSNYIEAFTNSDFINALWFTVKFTIVSVITVNLLAFSFALLLTQGLKGTNFYRTVFFMPNLIGGIVLGYIWQMIINGVLYPFEQTLYSNADYGFWGMVILTNWQLAGYMMIIYIAAIQNIPGSMIEAARVDGASSFQILRKVTIPMVSPAFTICLFLTLTNSFKMFDQNLALTAGQPGKETAMLALDIFNTFYSRIGYAGVGQAKAVVFFIIVAIVAGTQLWLSRKKYEAEV